MAVPYSEIENEFFLSVDLVKESLRHLVFLKEVDKVVDLKKDHVIYNAIRRYERLWLPLVGRFQDDANGPLEPPLDVHWVWHTHMLGKNLKNNLQISPFNRYTTKKC